MKFYHADVGAKQKLIAKLNKKAQLIGSQQAASDEDVDRALEMQMRKRLQTEIDDKNLVRFADDIDAEYKNAFIKQYQTFTHASEFLLPREKIAQFYDDFKKAFPSCHDLMAFIISSDSYRVELANNFDGSDVPSQSGITETDVNDDDNVELDQDAHELLHNRERAILEYFLAMIRLKNQKKLKYWSMLSPLGHHCKGFMQPGTKSHLNSASCTLRTAW